MTYYAMPHWALFVTYEGNKAQKFFTFYLSKIGFTNVAEIKLDCSYDCTLSKSQTEHLCID